MDFQLIWSSLPQVLGGLPDTLTLVVSALAIGFVLALGIAQLRLSGNLFLAGFAYGFVYIFRSTPLLVQIFLIYYGSGQFRPFLQDIGLWTFFREPYFCAILALSLNTAAYTSEIIRGGIQAVPLGQIEAGRAVGMSRWQLYRRVIFPLAIRQALPAYGNEVILMVKSSSLASTITILELTGIAKKLIATTFKPVEIFIVAGGIYLLLNFIVTQLIRLAERRLSQTSPTAAGGRQADLAANSLPIR